MAVIGSQWWECKACSHRVMTHDVGGKPFKKVPWHCPSCGHRCSKDCEKKHGPGTGPSRPDPKR
jgi:hypothetical protein